MLHNQDIGHTILMSSIYCLLYFVYLGHTIFKLSSLVDSRCHNVIRISMMSYSVPIIEVTMVKCYLFLNTLHCNVVEQCIFKFGTTEHNHGTTVWDSNLGLQIGPFI